MPFLSPADRPSAEALEPTFWRADRSSPPHFSPSAEAKGRLCDCAAVCIAFAARAEARAALAKHIPTWLPGIRSPSLASPSAEADGPSPLHRDACRSEELGPSKSPCAETLSVKSVSPGRRSHLVPRISSRCAACSPADRGRLEPPCLSNHSRSRETIHEGLRVRVRVATRFPPEGESLLPRRPTNP
jgi:hypothetical protein